MTRRCFIVIGRPRSGTTLLADSLNQHPEIVCHDEVFHYDRSLRKKYGPNGVAFEDGGDAAAYLEQHIFSKPEKFCGFKMLYDQARKTNLRECLKSKPDLVVFHLIRDNTLACEASGAAAYATGKWHTHRQGWPDHEPQVELDYHQLRRQFCIHDACYRETEHCFRRNQIVRVLYEDLVSSFAESMARFYEALGASPFVPEMRVKKMSQKPLRERVGNWEELKAAFSDTLYARFFDADNS